MDLWKKVHGLGKLCDGFNIFNISKLQLEKGLQVFQRLSVFKFLCMVEHFHYVLEINFAEILLLFGYKDDVSNHIPFVYWKFVI